MMHLELKRTALALFVVLTLCVACKQSSAPPPTLSIDQLPPALEKAFSAAPAETKELATQIITSVQAKDYGKAYSAIQSLATKSGLTKEQSSVTASGVLTLNTALQSAQASGDSQAAEVLQIHRRNK
jgi:hypothetical protein